MNCPNFEYTECIQLGEAKAELKQFRKLELTINKLASKHKPRGETLHLVMVLQEQADENAKLRKELAKVREENEWHKTGIISNPEHGNTVLARVFDGYEFTTICAHLLRDGITWVQDSEFIEAEGGWDGATKTCQKIEVTHWRELPKPPRIEEVKP